MAKALEHIHEPIRKLAVPLDQLTPYPGNARRGDLSMIVDSLQTHGQYKPITVRAKTNEVLAGNHTLAAAQQLGWKDIAVTFVDVDDDTAARIVLVDNRTSDLATYDDQALAELLQAVNDEDRGLAGTGFADEDLTDLLNHLNPDSLEDLAEEFGDPDDDDLWPTLALKLPPELKRRFEDALDSYDGDTLPDRLDQLLDAHPAHAGA